MFKESLKEKLDVQKNMSTKELEKFPAVKEVKLLMDTEGKEDMRILKGLGSAHQIIRADAAYGKQLEFEKLENTYAGDVYTLAQIKALAIDYHLRFLKSKYYTGVMDVEVVAKIKAFSKMTGVMIDDATLENRFYILSPLEHFNLKEETVFKPRQLDPVLFYSIDGKNFRFIHKWGSDFTFARLITGAKMRNATSYTAIKTFEVMPFIALLMSYLFSTFFIATSPLLFVVLMVIPSFLIALAIREYKYFNNSNDQTKEAWSEFSWNSDTIYKHER